MTNQEKFHFNGEFMKNNRTQTKLPSLGESTKKNIRINYPYNSITKTNKSSASLMANL